MRILQEQPPDVLRAQIERAVVQCPKQALTLDPAT
jgi:ferredoxin